MKKTLEYILKNITDHPDQISVEEKVTGSQTLLMVHAQKEDIGKIIGKKGRIIKALRDLIKLIAAKKNTYVDISLEES